MKFIKLLFILFLLISGAASAMDPQEKTEMNEEKIVSLANDLLEAALKGNTEQVKNILDAKANINHKTKTLCDSTPLMLATMFAQVPIVNLLLEHKANVNLGNEYGQTALFSAALSSMNSSEKPKIFFENQKAIIRLLLEHKAIIDQASNNSATPLMAAAAFAQAPVAKLLLERMASINQAAYNDETALTVAARYNNHAVSKFLVEKILSHCLDDSQKQRFYTVLWCLKKWNCPYDVRCYFKPWLHALAAEENRKNPKSRAYQEINKIKNLEIKKQLLEKCDMQASNGQCIIQ